MKPAWQNTSVPTLDSPLPTARFKHVVMSTKPSVTNVSRYFRESRLTMIPPISRETILNYLGSHVLGMPRSD